MSKYQTICHITTGHSPLDDRVFYKEVNSLRRKYQNVSIIAPNRQNIKEKDGVKFYLYSETRYFSNIVKAYKLARTIRADLYHIHDFELLPLAIILKYKYGKKVIYDVHETYYWFFIEFSKHSRIITLFPALFAQTLEWLGCLFMDWVITVTPWLARKLRPYCKNLSVIYNYPVLSIFPENRINMEKYKDPIILYHGHISPARNITVIVKAMKYVKEHFTNAKLLLVGNITGKYRAELDSIIETEDLDGYIEFRNRIPFYEVPSLLKSTALGVSSMAPNGYFKRSIQIKPFEFMSMGIPVLGCRVPSNEIFIEKIGSGLIVDPPTAEKLGEQIGRILGHLEIAEDMGRKGKRSVKQNYNWQKMEPILYQIYDDVLSREG